MSKDYRLHDQPRVTQKLHKSMTKEIGSSVEFPLNLLKGVIHGVYNSTKHKGYNTSSNRLTTLILVTLVLPT